MKRLVAVAESPSKLPNGHWDLTRRKPPRALRLKLERLKDKCFALRLELDYYGFYNDISGHLGDAEMALYQGIHGNCWRNEFHKRGAGKSSDSPYGGPFKKVKP